MYIHTWDWDDSLVRANNIYVCVCLFFSVAPGHQSESSFLDRLVERSTPFVRRFSPAWSSARALKFLSGLPFAHDIFLLMGPGTPLLRRVWLRCLRLSEVITWCGTSSVVPPFAPGDLGSYTDTGSGWFQPGKSSSLKSKAATCAGSLDDSKSDKYNSTCIRWSIHGNVDVILMFPGRGKGIQKGHETNLKQFWNISKCLNWF